MRALRPDRMLYALSLFVEEKLGRKYVENRTIECKFLLFKILFHSV
jgi:dynein heavy chain